VKRESVLQRHLNSRRNTLEALVRLFVQVWFVFSNQLLHQVFLSVFAKLNNLLIAVIGHNLLTAISKMR